MGGLFRTIIAILLISAHHVHGVELDLKLDQIDNAYIDFLKTGVDDQHKKFHVLSARFVSKLKKCPYKMAEKEHILEELEKTTKITTEQFCRLWHIWKGAEQRRNAKKATDEALIGDDISQYNPFRIEDVKIDCGKLEMYIQNNTKGKLDAEKRYWVEEYLRDVQKVHFDQFRQLFGKSEPPYMKGGEKMVFGWERIGRETKLALEMRRWHLDLENAENRANLAAVKGRMLAMMGDQLYNQLDEQFPVPMAIEQFDETMLALIYGSFFKNEPIWEAHLSVAYYFGRIWRLISAKEKMSKNSGKGGKKKKKESAGGAGILATNRRVGELWKEVMAKEFAINGDGLAWEMFRSWVELCHEKEFIKERGCEEAQKLKPEELDKTEDKSKMNSKQRSELLWKEHWESLKKLSKMPENFADRMVKEVSQLRKDSSVYGTNPPKTIGFWGRMADFFGGFDKIMEKLEHEEEESKSAIVKMFTPVKMSDNEINKEFAVNFGYILEHKPEEERDKYMQSKIGIDLRLYFQWMDEWFASGMPTNSKIVEKWEFARLEIDVYLDGLRDKKTIIWLQIPAYRLIKCLHKLKMKCENMSEKELLEWDLIGDMKGYKAEINASHPREQLELTGTIELELQRMRAKQMHNLLAANQAFRNTVKDIFKDNVELQNRFHAFFSGDKNKGDANVDKILAMIGAQNENKEKPKGKTLIQVILDIHDNILATMFKAYLNIPTNSDIPKKQLEKYKEEIKSKYGRYGTAWPTWEHFLEKLERKEYELAREMLELEGIHRYYRKMNYDLLVLAENYIMVKGANAKEGHRQLVDKLKGEFLDLIKRSGFDGTRLMICRFHVFLWTHLHVKLMEIADDEWKKHFSTNIEKHICQLSILPKYIHNCSAEEQLSILEQLKGLKKLRELIMDKSITTEEVGQNSGKAQMMPAKVQMMIVPFFEFIDGMEEFKAFIRGHKNRGNLKERLFELFGFDGLDLTERSYPVLFNLELIIHQMCSHYYAIILTGENDEVRRNAEMRLGLIIQFGEFLAKNKEVDKEILEGRGRRKKVTAINIQKAMARIADDIVMTIYPSGLDGIDYRNQLRAIKMFNDLREMSQWEHVEEGILAKQLKIVPFGEVEKYGEEILAKQRAHLAKKHYDFIRSEIEKNDHFCRILRDHIGAPYRLDMLLGRSPLEDKRYIELLYFHFDVKKHNEEWLDKNLEKLQDPMFFENDDRLLLHYTIFLNSDDNIARLRHELAANIVAWMRDLNRNILKSNSLNSYYKRYKLWMANGDQLRIRIEYDKVMTTSDEKELQKLAYIHRKLLKKMKTFPKTFLSLDGRAWTDYMRTWQQLPMNAMKSGEENFEKKLEIKSWQELQKMHFSMLQVLFEEIDPDKEVKKDEESEKIKMWEKEEKKEKFTKWVKIFTDVHTGGQMIKKRLLTFLSIEGIKKIMLAYFGYDIDKFDYIEREEKTYEEPKEESFAEKKKKTKKNYKKEKDIKNYEQSQSEHSSETVVSDDSIGSKGEQRGIEEIAPVGIGEGQERGVEKRLKQKKEKERKWQNIIVASPNTEQSSRRELDGILKRKNMQEIDENRLNIEVEGVSLKAYARGLSSKYYQFITHQNSSSAEFLFLLDIGSLIDEIERRFSIAKELKRKFPELYDDIWGAVVDKVQEYWEKEMNLVEEMKERWNVEELATMEFKLIRILNALVAAMENSAKIDENFMQEMVKEELTEKEAKENGVHLKSQLHLNNLAKLLATNEEYEREWREGIGDERKESLILLFSGIDMDELMAGKKVEEEGEENEAKRKELERELPKKRLKEFEKKYLNGWKKLYEQQKIDKALYAEYSQQPTKFAFTTHLDVDMNEFLQHYTLSKQQIIDESTKLTNELANAIGFAEMNDEESARRKQIDDAIGHLDKIVTQWGNQYAEKDEKGGPKKKTTFLMEGGAYQLGTLTTDSSIELKVISAQQIGYAKFFGSSTCIMNHGVETARICADSASLYCKLCMNGHVLNLSKRPTSLIPVIIFTYCPAAGECIEFDLTLVAIPGERAISRELLENVEELQKKFLKEGEQLHDIEWGDPRFAMLDLLSTHRFNFQLLDYNAADSSIISHRTARKNFRITLMAVEIWTKNHHIHSRSFGHLNRTALTILVAKIVLRYPSASVPFLLEQFFLTCLTWPWPMPIQLKSLSSGATGSGTTSEGQYRKMAWTAEKELGEKANILIPKIARQERQPDEKGREGMYGGQGRHIYDLAMPIIKPGFPEDNCAYTMNQSTMAIVRSAMAEGLRAIRQVRIGEMGWKELLDGGEKAFHQKYDHFILIDCRLEIRSKGGREEEELFDKFCNFYVNYRIRLNLIFHVERRNNIRHCHLASSLVDNMANNRIEEMHLKREEKGGQTVMIKLDGLRYYVKKWLVGVDAGGHQLPQPYPKLDAFIDGIRGDPSYGKTRLFKNSFEEKEFSRMQLNGEFISQERAKDLF